MGCLAPGSISIPGLVKSKLFSCFFSECKDSFQASTFDSALDFNSLSCLPNCRFSSEETCLNSLKRYLKTPLDPRYLIRNCSASSRVFALACSKSVTSDSTFSENPMMLIYFSLEGLQSFSHRSLGALLLSSQLLFYR